MSLTYKQKSITMKRKITVSTLLLMPFLSFCQTISDYDGNTYSVVKIGMQEWMGENLRSKHYANGDSIIGVLNNNNTENDMKKFGYLYTWEAAMHDSSIEKAQGACPSGWHIPTKQEFYDLFNEVGGTAVAGLHLKESGTDYWNSPNNADNTSGFSALGAGLYNSDPSYGVGFKSRGIVIGFWTSTQVAETKATQFALVNREERAIEYTWPKRDAYSIRCIKNSDDRTGIIPEKKNFNEF